MAETRGKARCGHLTKLTNSLDNLHMEPRLDRNALRFNQLSIITFTVIAFVLGTEIGRWLVLAVAAVLLLGTAFAPVSLFKLFYRHVVVRLGLMKPNIVVEDPAPHQFAQGIGGLFLLASFLVLAAGADIIGWVLAWIVVALAAVNLVAGFCLGCFIYLQLERRGLMPRSAGAR